MPTKATRTRRGVPTKTGINKTKTEMVTQARAQLLAARALMEGTFDLIGIPDAERRRTSHITEYARVLALAVDTFGSRWKASAWLNRPNRIFNQQSPLQALTLDPISVEEELVRIDHGMVS